MRRLVRILFLSVAILAAGCMAAGCGSSVKRDREYRAKPEFRHARHHHEHRRQPDRHHPTPDRGRFLCRRRSVGDRTTERFPGGERRRRHEPAVALDPPGHPCARRRDRAHCALGGPPLGHRRRLPAEDNRCVCAGSALHDAMSVAETPGGWAPPTRPLAGVTFSAAPRWTLNVRTAAPARSTPRSSADV